MRALVRETKDEVAGLERERSRVSSEAALMSLSVIIATGLASVVFLYLARVLIVRELRRRQRAERALQRMNLDLEGIVAERTEDLTHANEELRVEIRRRQQAEEAERLQRQELRASEQHLRDVIDNLFAFVGVLTPEGILLEANRTALAADHLHAEDVIGKPFEETYWWSWSPDAQRQLREAVARAARGEPMRYDATLRFGKDRFVPVDFMLAPLVDRSGRVTHLIPSGVDLTERKRAEDALRESEERLRASKAQLDEIIDTALDAIINVNPDEKIVLFNAAAERMFACPAAEAVGERVSRFIPGLRCSPSGSDAAEPRANRPGVVTGVRADGEQFSAEASVSELEVDGGKHRTVILRDITERRQIEAEREELLAREQEARQQAEDANRLKDEFVATISHELRAPLNAILGWVRLLRAGKLDVDNSTKALDTIERSAHSQARLIDDLLDISRIITGKLRLDVRTVDPNAVIRSAIEAVGPAADAKSIALDAELDQAIGVISGDPNRLQQIIWNLLSNAIKFTPKGGRVRIESTRGNSQVTITIADNGQGISSEFLPHVFDRFRQGDSSSSRRHGGLGLGLAIVRHLVEMHGGTARASSAGTGKGATFTVTLPVLPLRVRQPQPASAQRPGEWKTAVGNSSMLDGLLVLVVDDEEDARQMLTQMLALYGATVIAAGSASEALSVLSRQQPDVMVSDVGMPGEDGYTLIKKVRSRGLGKGGNLPAVALTAYAQPKDRMQALAAGFQHHVPKPADPNELVTVIASLTGRLHGNGYRRA